MVRCLYVRAVGEGGVWTRIDEAGHRMCARVGETAHSMPGLLRRWAVGWTSTLAHRHAHTYTTGRWTKVGKVVGKRVRWGASVGETTEMLAQWRSVQA